MQLKPHLASKQRRSPPSHLSQMNLSHYEDGWAPAYSPRAAARRMEQHTVVMTSLRLIADHPMNVTNQAMHSYR